MSGTMTYCRRDFVETPALLERAIADGCTSCDCPAGRCFAESGCDTCYGLGWVEDSEGVRFACPRGCVLPERES